MIHSASKQQARQRPGAAMATALGITLALTLSLGACAPAEPPKRAITKAAVAVSPLQGRSVQGGIELSARNDGLQILGELSGLKGPRQEYRIHQFGDCSDPRGRSAGEPFDGKGTFSSLITDTEADATGESTLDAFHEGARLSGEYSIVGRALVVHRVDRDERGIETRTRVGCGVIGVTAER